MPVLARLSRIASKLRTIRPDKFRFTEENKVGRGGMADIFRQTLRNGKHIAVKIARLLVPHGRAFLEHEISILRGLNHPNIIKYLKHGEIKEGLYLAMELVNAKNLFQCLQKSGPIAIADALDIVEKVADALSYIYAKKKVVHADIKPSNILWHPDSKVVKLIDFAFARKEKSASEIEIKRKAACFTPGYATIERLKGKNPEVRDDVFALGVTLYEMLTGKRALFVDNGDMKARLRKHEDLGIKIGVSRKIPNSIKDLLLRMTGTTHWGGHQRYAYFSYGELIADIRAAKKAISKKPAKDVFSPEFRPTYELFPEFSA
jgi:serine/threonine-protein kinase